MSERIYPSRAHETVVVERLALGPLRSNSVAPLAPTVARRDGARGVYLEADPVFVESPASASNPDIGLTWETVEVRLAHRHVTCRALWVNLFDRSGDDQRVKTGGLCAPEVIARLNAPGIDARHLWMPVHPTASFQVSDYGGSVSRRCLTSA